MLDFEIPTDIDELMRADGDPNQYRVKRVLKGSEIAAKLDGKCLASVCLGLPTFV